MDKYEVTHELGRGEQGVVSVVRRRSDGVNLFCKEVWLSAYSVEQRARAFDEAERLKDLHHPHIVTYIEHFEERGALFLITEYATGGDLGTAIESCRCGGSPMPEEVIVRTFHQLALALHHLHSLHHIHRDVESANVFLTGSGDVKLGDLGVSIVLPWSGAMASTFSGTEAYCAPEMILGQRYDSKIDVWSLGVVLYEMMACRLPFAGKGYRLQKAIVTEPHAVVPESYSVALRDAVERCLTKDPDARPDIAMLLLDLPLLRNAESVSGTASP